MRPPILLCNRGKMVVKIKGRAMPRNEEMMVVLLNNMLTLCFISREGTSKKEEEWLASVKWSWEYRFSGLESGAFIQDT